MKSVILSLSILLLIFCVNMSAYGESEMSNKASSSSWDDPQWVKESERVINSPVDAGCKERWDVAWAWAKKGNLQARYMLADMAEWSALIPPTGTENKGSYVLIMGVHALGYHDDYPGSAAYHRNLIERIKQSKNFSGKEAFLACIKNENSPKCTQMAVDAKFVPSFADFAKVIDQAIAKGNKPACGAIH